MNAETQDTLDVVLTEHLSAQLSGQLGRASGAFEAHVNAQRLKDQSRRNRRAWIVATFPAALAACIALIAAIGYWHEGQKKAVGPPIAESGTFDQTTYYRDVDDGTIVVNSPNGPVPVRAIRRQIVDETQWIDPKDQSKRSVRVPREMTVYVGLRPY